MIMTFEVNLVECHDAWSNVIREITDNRIGLLDTISERVIKINLVLAQYNGKYKPLFRVIEFDSEESYTHFLLAYN